MSQITLYGPSKEREGPGIWWVLLKAADSRKSYFPQLATDTIEEFFCESCVPHGKLYLSNNPIPHNSTRWFEWVVAFHNSVNQRLGKRIISVEQAHMIMDSTKKNQNDKWQGYIQPTYPNTQPQQYGQQNYSQPAGNQASYGQQNNNYSQPSGNQASYGQPNNSYSQPSGNQAVRYASLTTSTGTTNIVQCADCAKITPGKSGYQPVKHNNW